jgi:glutamate--cysteine ligase
VDYKDQINEIKRYFKHHEKKRDNFKIGVEFEHYVIDKDTFQTISYYGKNGVGETLKELADLGWNPTYEGEYVLGLKKDKKTISLEPGSQLELSIDADMSIRNIEVEYKKFIDEIYPILSKKGQMLITVGYHPVTKIDEITLLPKKRYDLMFNYFKDKGRNAHNMMKGTAALQVSIDYSSEEDYRKKFRLANAISPVLYALFDNSFYFEGEEWEYHNLRTNIWNNCDVNRAGTVEGALEDSFGYENYAKYILNRPPIFMIEDGKVIATGEKKVRELFDPNNYDIAELEHFLTMFFPDVRTKAFIEIRQMDSVPYTLALSAIALIKGIFYNDENLNTAYEKIKSLDIEDINRAKYDIIENGLEAKLKGKNILEFASWLINLAKNGLEDSEIKYIYPLEEMVEKGENPYEKIKSLSHLGKKKALEWCVVKERGESN